MTTKKLPVQAVISHKPVAGNQQSVTRDK